MNELSLVRRTPEQSSSVYLFGSNSMVRHKLCKIGSFTSEVRKTTKLKKSINRSTQVNWFQIRFINIAHCNRLGRSEMIEAKVCLVLPFLRFVFLPKIRVNPSQSEHQKNVLKWHSKNYSIGLIRLIKIFTRFLHWNLSFFFTLLIFQKYCKWKKD